jgi:dGTPase
MVSAIPEYDFQSYSAPLPAYIGIIGIFAIRPRGGRREEVMLRREDCERREYEILSEFAAKSAQSRGRKTPEKKCDFRTDFQRDRDRILHSKAFRRLMHKTQVFLAPEGDHYRTRLTHTLEVSQIARSIARGLRLNEDLTEAIATGHDLGHTPFGHNGEIFLAQRHSRGFRHNEQSLRVIDVLETSELRQGMNLTEEVRDGILNHTGAKAPFTLEGQIVKISDRVAYINHDIDDALRSNIIKKGDLPRDCVEILGDSTKARINKLVADMIENSDGRNVIAMGEECAYYMNKLRDFMFESVYYNSIVKKDEELEKVRNLIFSLYGYFLENPQALPEEYGHFAERDGLEEIAKDMIAGMTDRYAINMYVQLFVPEGWQRRRRSAD